MAGEVTVLQLQNAALDVATIAEVCMVNYTDDTTTNRDGDVINTLQGQLKALGFLPPVTYAVGIAFTGLQNTKTIERSGFIYAPNPSDLPFTTSGTWAADDELKFYVVQTQTTTIEGLRTDIDDLVTLTGVAVNSTSLGTFTGAIIADNSTIKVALQAEETAIGNLNTLSGVALNEPDLGTFTGSTIPNDSTIKAALQSLETGLESIVTLASGTWTPTASSLVNLDSATPQLSLYTQVGSIVFFSGSIGLDATASGTASFRLTLPVASNFGATTDAAGVITGADTPRSVGTVGANIASNVLDISIDAGGTSSFGAKFSGSYRVI